MLAGSVALGAEMERQKPGVYISSVFQQFFPGWIKPWPIPWVEHDLEVGVHLPDS